VFDAKHSSDVKTAIFLLRFRRFQLTTMLRDRGALKKQAAIGLLENCMP
jgi:hypothetical protein